MSNINTVAISGNLTRDPVSKTLPSGTTVAELGIAVNRSRKGEDGEWTDEVSYFDVSVFGNFADLCDRKLRKADGVAIQGRLEQQRWEKDGEKRSKVVVIAEKIDSPSFFLRDEEVKPRQDAAATAVAGEQAELPTTPTDDDIPF